MRRAVLQVLRPAVRRPFFARRLLRTRSSLISSSTHHAIAPTAVRNFTSRRGSTAFASAVASSPFMQFRYSATLIAAAVAGGALYYNAGQNPLRADSARGPLTASD